MKTNIMKKIFTTMLCFATYATMTNATTFYVDPTNGNDTYTGTTWGTAVKTLSAASTLAASVPGVDDIYVKGGAIAVSASWSPTDNIYGGFAGESTPAQRATSDKDNNGIIEPWEFTTPTTYTVTGYNGTAINLGAIVLDGFTITQTATAATGSTVNAIAGSNLKNCVLTGSNLTYNGAGNTSTVTGCLIQTIGSVKNCLVANNTVSITYPALDIKISPVLAVNVPSTTTNISVDGCVVRNNKATITNTLYTTATTSNLRGLVINIADNGVSNTVGTKSAVTVSNCLVYNNEFSFTGNNSYLTSTHGSIVGILNFSTNNTTNSFVHCTFANNKLTNMLSCMEVKPAGNNALDYAINNVIDNVFWNNKNTVSSTATTSAVSIASSSSQYSGSTISNNYMDVATTGTWGTTVGFSYTGNVTDLSMANSGINSPLFITPTSTVGNTVDGSSELANWKFTGVLSYLYQKGVTTSIATDLAGNTFASSPSVGAYEYFVDTPTAINEQNQNDNKLISQTKSGIISNVNGSIQVFSINGIVLLNTNVLIGQQISLPSGAYIIKVTSEGSFNAFKVII